MRFVLYWIYLGILVATFGNGCQQAAPDRYVIYLHGRFLEDNAPSVAHPDYGRYAYSAIIDAFSAADLRVIGAIRPPQTNARSYAQQVVRQIDSLIERGTAPEHITVVGASKGGYIAQYVSTLAENPALNFVFLACYQESDIEAIPEINYCGNILTIYERSDPYGVSALRRKETSSLPIPRFQEVELRTGLQHGFLYQPLREWMTPAIAWAKGDYASVE